MKKRNDSQAQSNLIFQQARRSHQSGEISRAVTLYGQVLSEQPRHTDSLYHLGEIAFRAGNLEQSATLLNRLLQIDPQYAAAYDILWQVCQASGDNAGAIRVLERRLELRPRDAYCHFNIGVLQQMAGNLQAARQSFEEALRWKSDDARLHGQYGSLLRQMNQTQAAVEAFSKAVLFDPRNAMLHSNLGYLLLRQGKTEEAIRHYDKAVALMPGDEMIRSNRAQALLRAGQLQEGFAEAERRLQLKEYQPQLANYQAIPRWLGEPVQGKTLLVHHEQSLVDTLQFARYLPMVKATGVRLILAVPKTLQRVFSNLNYIDRVIEDTPDSIRTCQADKVVSLLSLPALFQTSLATIPSHTPYLFADPFLTHSWSLRMDWKKLRVGLAWDGGLHDLLPLAAIQNISYYSLQRNQLVQAVANPVREFPLIDAAAGLDDFADSAALLANLDLVITADTAVAHLASAMGRQVWMLLPHEAHARWLDKRAASPWYPTMRLFRQTVPGDWKTVIRQVVAALGELPGPHQEILRIERKSSTALAEAALI